MPAAVGNRLLAALPVKEQRKLLAACDEVELRGGNVLHDAGKPLRYVYFPTGGLIALVTPLDACAGLEIALVGSEGMTGVSTLLGVSESSVTHLVQAAGGALRIGATSFQHVLGCSTALRQRLNRYAYVNMQQIAQAAACTRFHLIEERLARWLLMAHDRSCSDALHATHEFLAYMLGVRRVGITKAAASLQDQSLIRYSRGNITILDHDGLAARACGCYLAARQMYERILG
ncbi:MAG: Crp/Fnr family transcriptional regulator [Rhodanobacteraceae bacterium]|nr:Crp/Fnr family transcriptional regulator [Rhodanobacteraceae bacterium]